MTYKKLMDELDTYDCAGMVEHPIISALRSITEMHKPYVNYKDQECFCVWCGETYAYPCPTVAKIVTWLDV